MIPHFSRSVILDTDDWGLIPSTMTPLPEDDTLTDLNLDLARGYAAAASRLIEVRLPAATEDE